MNFIPYEYVKLESELSESEISESLKNRVIKNTKFGLLSNKHPFKEYEGYIRKNKFKIRGLSKKKKSIFNPIISGEFYENEPRSIVKINIHFHYIINSAFIIFSVLLLYAFINELYTSKFSYNFSEDEYIKEILSEEEYEEISRIEKDAKTVNWDLYFMDFIFPYMIILFGFNSEAKKAKNDIADRLNADVIKRDWIKTIFPDK